MSKSIPEELMDLKKRIEKEDKELKRREEARKLKEERKKNEEFSLDDLPQISIAPEVEELEQELSRPIKVEKVHRPFPIKALGILGSILCVAVGGDIIGNFSGIWRSENRQVVNEPLEEKVEVPLVGIPHKIPVKKPEKVIPAKPLEQKVRTGYVTITPYPTDSMVKIMDITPLYYPGIKVKEGWHQFRVERNGYDTVNKQIFIEGGTHLKENISLKKAYVPPQPKITPKPEGWKIETYSPTGDDHVYKITPFYKGTHRGLYGDEETEFKIYHNGKLIRKYTGFKRDYALSPKGDKLMFMDWTRESWDHFNNFLSKPDRRYGRLSQHLKVLYPDGSEFSVAYMKCVYRIGWINNDTIEIDPGKRCNSWTQSRKGRIKIPERGS